MQCVHGERSRWKVILLRGDRDQGASLLTEGREKHLFKGTGEPSPGTRGSPWRWTWQVLRKCCGWCTGRMHFWSRKLTGGSRPACVAIRTANVVSNRNERVGCSSCRCFYSYYGQGCCCWRNRGPLVWREVTGMCQFVLKFFFFIL